MTIKDVFHYTHFAVFRTEWKLCPDPFLFHCPAPIPLRQGAKQLQHRRCQIPLRCPQTCLHDVGRWYPDRDATHSPCAQHDLSCLQAHFRSHSPGFSDSDRHNSRHRDDGSINCYILHEEARSAMNYLDPFLRQRYFEVKYIMLVK